jgi:hypothetical protein
VLAPVLKRMMHGADEVNATPPPPDQHQDEELLGFRRPEKSPS